MLPPPPIGSKLQQASIALPKWSNIAQVSFLSPYFIGLEQPDVRSTHTSSGIARIDNKGCRPDNIRIIKSTMIGYDDDTVSTLQMLVIKWHASQHCFLKSQCWYI